MRSVARCPIKSQVKLESLPPISAAAREHSLRAYHQVQQWLNNYPQLDWAISVFMESCSPSPPLNLLHHRRFSVSYIVSARLVEDAAAE